MGGLLLVIFDNSLLTQHQGKQSNRMQRERHLYYGLAPRGKSHPHRL